MKGRTEGRGCVAEDERGVFGVAVDHFGGRWRGFELRNRTRLWSSAAPRKWYGSVIEHLRSQLPRVERV